MHDLIKEIKNGYEGGSAVGATVAGVYKAGSSMSDGLEPLCRAGLQAAQVGSVAGGVLGATALGSLSVLKTTRRSLDVLHQKVQHYHGNSHLASEPCILCNPNKVLTME